MFIAIVGPRFSGKTTLENYLITQKGFTSVRLVPHRNTHTKLSSKDGTGFSHQTLGRNSFLSMGNLPSPLIPEANWRSYREDNTEFYTPDALLAHVTKHWQDTNFVTDSLTSVTNLETFARRPFFIVVYVHAPLMVRFERSSGSFASLESFVRAHDSETFGYPSSSQNAQPKASSSLSSICETRNIIIVNVTNASNSIHQFHEELDEIDLLNEARLRPDWDTYFMTLASLASHRSNCMKRRVGAILVRDNRLVATGYNGTPRGLPNCKDGGCDHCNGRRQDDSLLYECLCLHAEENALLESGRQRLGDGAVLYCNTAPCLKCAIKIIQSGIKEVVYELDYKVDEAAGRLFSKAGVKLRKHVPLPKSIDSRVNELTNRLPGAGFAEE